MHTKLAYIVKNVALSIVLLSQELQVFFFCLTHSDEKNKNNNKKIKLNDPPHTLWCCFHHEVTGDTGVPGCSHTNASLLTDRWHTSRPICSFTSTIKIHGSIFHCPVCQGCSIFFSVKWIKWAGGQRKCSFQTSHIVAFLRYAQTDIWSCLWLAERDGLWFQSSESWPLILKKGQTIKILSYYKKN